MLKPYSQAHIKPDDVIDRALEVLHEQDDLLTANRQIIDAKIRTGIAEMERGEGIPEDQLAAYLGRLKAHPACSPRFGQSSAQAGVAVGT